MSELHAFNALDAIDKQGCPRLVHADGVGALSPPPLHAFSASATPLTPLSLHDGRV